MDRQCVILIGGGALPPGPGDAAMCVQGIQMPAEVVCDMENRFKILDNFKIPGALRGSKEAAHE